MGNNGRLYFLGSKITADGNCSHEIKKCLLLGRKSMTNLDSILKKQRHYFAKKVPSSQSYGFSSSHVWVWELDYKESWAQKNWCSWTAMLEKTLESPLDCKEIQPVHPKGNQSWIFIPWKDWCWSWNSNSLATWSIELTHWKRPWCWEGLRTEGEGVDRGWDGWMPSQLNGHEQTQGDSKGQESLACGSSWASKSQTQLNNWTTASYIYFEY